MEFIKLKNAVSTQFNRMKDYPLFRAQVEKDKLWDTYLSSFPEGTNPIYRERTEHDCSCCKQFIRAVGDVVANIDGKLVSIWDVEVGDPDYQVVADALAKLVKSVPIENIFLHIEKTAGTDKSFEEVLNNVKTWDHFFIRIPQQNYCRGVEIGPKLSEAKALHDVMYRSLTELTDDAIDTVLELIAQNSLYRGEEHRFAVAEFKKLKREFNALSEENKDSFVWSRINTVPASVAKIRNTAIGTLLVNLSKDMDLEDAVRAFEVVVAPSNYKRPTALVTKAMVEKAKEKIESLGLTSALQRRYAKLSDISINDILFADRGAKQIMTGDVFSEIASSIGNKKPKNIDKVEEVPIEKFISDILPTATSIEIMPENSHIKNLVSLIAPMDPAAGQLFKWDNNFSWAYNGDMADSIKERVKRAGGNVTGDLCCRLGWYNYDDLDFHMVEPSGFEIYYGSKHSPHTGGKLDVDMNAGGGKTREPVENIFYSHRAKMKEGKYSLRVHNFCRRENTDVGFEVEVDFLGQTWNFVYDKPVRNGETITVMEFIYSHVGGIKVLSSLPATSSSKNVWGLSTNAFHKVNVMMMSPNHWENSRGVGNKHYFFMLDNCVNPDEARGFFNEFLKEELNEHRKVFEIVGSKMKAPATIDQLSGLGFSSTKKDKVLCKVTGSFTRTIKIVF